MTPQRIEINPRAAAVYHSGKTGRYSASEYMAHVLLNDGLPLREKGSKSYRFVQQHKAAVKRGIAWEITFAEWVGLWNESGKWDLRGVGKGRYCMARAGDAGPYKLGNVRIALNEDNAIECAALTKPRSRAKGYSKVYRNKRKPFTAKAGRTLIGHYATAEEAAAARIAFAAANGYRFRTNGTLYRGAA